MLFVSELSAGGRPSDVFGPYFDDRRLSFFFFSVGGGPDAYHRFAVECLSLHYDFFESLLYGCGSKELVGEGYNNPFRSFF